MTFAVFHCHKLKTSFFSVCVDGAATLSDHGHSGYPSSISLLGTVVLGDRIVDDQIDIPYELQH